MKVRERLHDEQYTDPKDVSEFVLSKFEDPHGICPFNVAVSLSILVEILCDRQILDSEDVLKIIRQSFKSGDVKFEDESDTVEKIANEK